MLGTRVWSLGWEDSLEKEMATHYSILCLGNPMDRRAWKAAQSMGSQRVRHDWATQPTQGRQSCEELREAGLPLLLWFSHQVVSDSLWPRALQHTRIPCPSSTPRVYLNSCPLSQWYHSTIPSSIIPFSSCLQSFPDQGLSNESAHHIMGTKYWSFSISSSNEYSGLISVRIDWFDLLAAQWTLKRYP